jgi:NAD+ synthase
VERIIYLNGYTHSMAENRLPHISSVDVDHIVNFIRSSVTGAGAEGAVIGLSGGLDSAVVTKLAADAIGPENVLNVFMPSRVTPHNDYRLTSELCGIWGTEYKIVDIQPAVDSLTAVLQSGEQSLLERGNISARCRMIVLYNLAKKRKYIVLGTSNQSELMMGYFTKFGDGACDMTPLANVYKTQVKEIGRMIGVPEEVLLRPPTAGFWETQTDEDEMGITYDKLDLILHGLEQEVPDKDIALSAGVSQETIMSIRDGIRSTEHKRLLPLRPDELYE